MESILPSRRQDRPILAALFDERGARLAGDFVLRAGAAGTADRADQFAADDERNAAPGRNDVVQGRDVVIAALDRIFKDLGFA